MFIFCRYKTTPTIINILNCFTGCIFYNKLIATIPFGQIVVIIIFPVAIFTIIYPTIGIITVGNTLSKFIRLTRYK